MTPIPDVMPNRRPAARRRRGAAFVLALAAAVPAAAGATLPDAPPAATAPPASGPPLPRVALVLSGGGARGLAHIGVLKALEEMRVPVGCVVGTSMGGAVGATYASGMPVAEIERAARAIDWADAFQDRPDRDAMSLQRKRSENGYLARPEFGFRDGRFVLPGGFIYGQQLGVLFSLLTRRADGVEDFAQLPLPFKAVATDIETGQAVLLERGALPVAMRATMAVPGVMAPVEIDGRALVDGVLVDNLPVAVARRACGDAVIAVNLGTTLLRREETRTAVGVGWQMINILTEQNVGASLALLGPQDVLVAPELDGFDLGSFDQADALIARGYEATRKAAPALARHAVDAASFAAWKARRESLGTASDRVDEIRIAPTRRVNREVLVRSLALAPGPISDAAFIDELARLHARGDFERVGLQLRHEGGRRVALVEPAEKSWGPHYLRFGISLNAQTGEAASFDAVVSSLQTWLNDYGGEWRNVLQLGQHSGLLSEFFQPLGVASPWFVAPRVVGAYESLPIYDGDEQRERVTRTRAYVGAELGREFGTAGEARIGFARGREAIEGEVGPLAGISRWRSLGALVGRVEIDQLDNAHFPTRGQRLDVEWLRERRAYGADADYTRSLAEFTTARTWRKNALSASLLSGRVRGDAGVLDRLPMGGFQRLSAYPIGRFRADAVDFGRAGYQRVIAPPLGLELGGLVSRMYAGGSLEIAQIRQSADLRTEDGVYRSLSVFVGAETGFGPATLGFGVGRDNQRSLWLSIGVPWTPR